MAWTFNKPVFRPSDISTGLVGYWKFNNDATAATGTNLTAVNTPTYATTTYWKDGEYHSTTNGSDEYFKIAKADAGTLQFTGKSFSFFGQVKFNSLTDAYFCHKWTANKGFRIAADVNGRIEVVIDATTYSGTN